MPYPARLLTRYVNVRPKRGILDNFLLAFRVHAWRFIFLRILSFMAARLFLPALFGVLFVNFSGDLVTGIGFANSLEPFIGVVSVSGDLCVPFGLRRNLLLNLGFSNFIELCIECLQVNWLNSHWEPSSCRRQVLGIFHSESVHFPGRT